MNKEYFKILKEINSLDQSVLELDRAIADENLRIEKLRTRETETRSELEAREEYLKTLKLESQKNENLLAALDARISKASSDLNSSIDPKHVAALGKEKEKLEQELEEAEANGLELLDEMDQISELIAENQQFLAGIAETILEISGEVSASVSQLTAKKESIQSRIAANMEQLPPNFATSYQTVKQKNLSISPFASIDSGKCSMCKMSIDRTRQAEVEEQLLLKSCPSCSRLFLPKESAY